MAMVAGREGPAVHRTARTRSAIAVARAGSSVFSPETSSRAGLRFSALGAGLGDLVLGAQGLGLAVAWLCCRVVFGAFCVVPGQYFRVLPPDVAQCAVIVLVFAKQWFVPEVRREGDERGEW